jgi:hypothetical protein
MSQDRGGQSERASQRRERLDGCGVEQLVEGLVGKSRRGTYAGVAGDVSNY